MEIRLCWGAICVLSRGLPALRFWRWLHTVMIRPNAGAGSTICGGRCRYVRSGSSLGWGVLGLRAWDACPDEAASWLARSHARHSARAAGVIDLALSLLAASGRGLALSDRAETKCGEEFAGVLNKVILRGDCS